MNNPFGKSPAAVRLMRVLNDDHKTLSKCSRFFAIYNRFLNSLLSMEDLVIAKRILNLEYPIEFTSSREVRSLCRNIMDSNRRKVLKELNNRGA